MKTWQGQYMSFVCVPRVVSVIEGRSMKYVGGKKSGLAEFGSNFRFLVCWKEAQK